MKILIINGSPKGKKSNSLKLAEAFVRGCGSQDVTVRHLTDYDIRPCRGCFACWTATPGECVIKDDASRILADLLHADLIVWSFPLYYYTVPGILKNLIDRQLPHSQPFMAARDDGVGNGSHPSRYERGGQKHVLVSTCGFYTSEGNYDAVERMFDHICGKDQYTTLFCGQGELFGVAELRNTTDHYLNVVQRAGREYVEGRISTETREQLADLLFPQEVFEAMADASWEIQDSEAAGRPEAAKGQNFTRQMAALYRKESYPGQDRVLEFFYTDLEETYQIVLGKDGYRFLNSDFLPSTTRIETPFTVWKDIAAGTISGTEALAQHRYRVTGSFQIMLDWEQIFYGGENAEAGAEMAAVSPVKPTKMSIMLIPWMVIWIFAAMDPFLGGIAGILVSAAVPMLWLRYEATIYEYLTILMVSGLSLAVLLDVDIAYVLPVSYGLFGMLWFASVFCRIPLTANYSKNEYGGNKAYQNALFIRTNRILTAGWGILYLLTPIWTRVIMTSHAAPYSGAINSVLPVLMGIFTAWFQRWYPDHVAGANVR